MEVTIAFRVLALDEEALRGANAAPHDGASSSAGGVTGTARERPYLPSTLK
jgi:hypothetical protein